MSTTLVFVGIDVTKARLNIALRPSGQQWSVSHDGLGITRVVERLRALQPTLVVLQATGGLELALTGALMAAGLPLVVAHPRQVRDFAKATGQLAKTDSLDARVVARFAEVVRPTPQALPEVATQELNGLLARRRQLVEMLTAEQHSLGSASAEWVRQDIEAHISWLTTRLAGVNADLAQAIQASPLWREKDPTFEGVGWIEVIFD